MELDEGTERKIPHVSSRAGDAILPVVIWSGGRVDEYVAWKVASGAWNQMSAYGFRRCLIQFEHRFIASRISAVGRPRT